MIWVTGCLINNTGDHFFIPVELTGKACGSFSFISITSQYSSFMRESDYGFLKEEHEWEKHGGKSGKWR